MKITVILLTWAPSLDSGRHHYAIKTLTNALAKLRFNSGQLHFHIADDGSAPGHVEELIRIAASFNQTVSVTNAERGGYGKSFNLATQVAHIDSELILPLEDDWELTRTLDLDPLANALLDPAAGLGCIRLGYLGFTQRMTGELVKAGGMTFLKFAWDCAEPHVFAGHPRLETVAFQRRVGLWPEGLAAGLTEWEVAHRAVAREGVAWPLDLPGMCANPNHGALFAHIGTEGVGEVEP